MRPSGSEEIIHELVVGNGAREHAIAKALAKSNKVINQIHGQSTADASGNSNHGTLQGGAAYSNDVPSGDGGGGTSSAAQINWLVADHLGTPRMIIDQTGTLANIKRHDYLPFAEELFAPAGGRSAAMGYTSGDGLRQQFTLKERDVETGLDYFLARYYSSTQGSSHHRTSSKAARMNFGYWEAEIQKSRRWFMLKSRIHNR